MKILDFENTRSQINEETKPDYSFLPMPPTGSKLNAILDKLIKAGYSPQTFKYLLSTADDEFGKSGIDQLDKLAKQLDVDRSDLLAVLKSYSKEQPSITPDRLTPGDPDGSIDIDKVAPTPAERQKPNKPPMPRPYMSTMDRVLKRTGLTNSELIALANDDSFISKLTDAMNASQRRKESSLQVSTDDVKSLLAYSLKVPYGDLFNTTTASATTMPTDDEALGYWQEPVVNKDVKNDLASLMNLDAESPKTHTVASGENLAKIAKRYGVDVGDLAAANGKGLTGKKSLIFPGEKLKIPSAAIAPAAKSTVSPSIAATPAAEKKYIMNYGWWTPQRQKYAIDYLIKNARLSKEGAIGLVTRWTLESPSGPSSINPLSKATGIAQWLGPRKKQLLKLKDNDTFEVQLKHAVDELNGVESTAARLLRSADTAEEAAKGATAYERAENYDAKTRTDVLTATTKDRYKTVAAAYDGKTEPSSEEPVDVPLPRRRPNPPVSSKAATGMTYPPTGGYTYDTVPDDLGGIKTPMPSGLPKAKTAKTDTSTFVPGKQNLPPADNRRLTGGTPTSGYDDPNYASSVDDIIADKAIAKQRAEAEKYADLANKFQQELEKLKTQQPTWGDPLNQFGDELQQAIRTGKTGPAPGTVSGNVRPTWGDPLSQLSNSELEKIMRSGKQVPAISTRALDYPPDLVDKLFQPVAPTGVITQQDIEQGLKNLPLEKALQDKIQLQLAQQAAEELAKRKALELFRSADYASLPKEDLLKQLQNVWNSFSSGAKEMFKPRIPGTDSLKEARLKRALEDYKNIGLTGRLMQELVEINKTTPVKENATAGATSAANIGTVVSPHLAIGKARGNKSYTGSPGRSGTKAPKPPKVTQPTNPDGTAKNALDLKGISIFGGPIKR